MISLGENYRHYKGGEYEILALAKDEETHEDLVVYRNLADASLVWVRPLARFVEDVEWEGKTVRRFTKF